MLVYRCSLYCNDMMTTRAAEHFILKDNSDFADKAKEAFGTEGSECLIDALIASYDMAYDYLPLAPVVGRVTIEIYDDTHGQPAMGRARFTDRRLKLGINSASGVDEIITELPNMIVHEVAHLAHMEHNSSLFIERLEPSNLHFGSALVEGVAAHAGRSLGAFSIYTTQMIIQQKVVDALAQLLCEPEEGQLSTYQEFMQGTEGFSNKGYRIGEFVVSRMASEESMSIAELMVVSFGEFREFAKSLL